MINSEKIFNHRIYVGGILSDTDKKRIDDYPCFRDSCGTPPEDPPGRRRDNYRELEAPLLLFAANYRGHPEALHDDTSRFTPHERGIPWRHIYLSTATPPCGRRYQSQPNSSILWYFYSRKKSRFLEYYFRYRSDDIVKRLFHSL